MRAKDDAPKRRSGAVRFASDLNESVAMTRAPSAMNFAMGINYAVGAHSASRNCALMAGSFHKVLDKTWKFAPVPVCANA